MPDNLAKGESGTLAKAGKWTGVVVAIGSPIVGFVKGWRQSTRAEEQHRDLVTQREMLQTENTNLKNWVEKTVSKTPAPATERLAAEDTSKGQTTGRG